jgi:hypothetical protein
MFLILLGLPAVAQEDVDALLKKLGSERQEERDAASKELIRRGRPLRETLERVAKDPDPEIAARVHAILEAIDLNIEAALEVIARLSAEEKESHQRFLWKVQRWLEKAVAGRSWEELLASFDRQKITATDIWERDRGIDYRFLVRKDVVATPQHQTMDLFFEFNVKRVASAQEKTLRVVQGSKAGLLTRPRLPLQALLAEPLFPAESAIQKVLSQGDLHNKELPVVAEIEMTYGPINDRWRETIPSGFHLWVTCVDQLEARIGHFRSYHSVSSGLDPEKSRDGTELTSGVYLPKDTAGDIRPWGGSGTARSTAGSSFHGLVRLDLTTTRQTSFWMNYSTELVPEAWSLADLAALPDTIRTLHVRGTFITDEGVKSLVRFRSLETLHLCESNFGDDALTPLAELPALTFLCLRGGKVSNQGVGRLRDLPKLTRLELSGMALLTDEGVAQVGALAALTHLEIRGARQVTDKALHALSGRSKLEELEFWLSAAITDDGLAALARLPRLKFAELSELKSVTPAGWAALAKAPSLRELYFNYCALDDDGLAELGKIKDLEFLVYHQLRDTGKISDAGLLGLKNLTNLRRLLIYSKPVTEEGMKTLQEKLPGRYLPY